MKNSCCLADNLSDCNENYAIPKLSVIVPAYQAANSIERLLHSLLTWDGDDMEIIVVDDGSTDDTASVVSAVASVDNRVRLVSQPNKGRSSARNAGVSQVHGEWIMFADSDDFYLETWSGEVLDAIRTGDNLTIFGMTQNSNLDTAKESLDFPSCKLPASVVLDALVNNSMCAIVESADSFEWNACWARLYRKSIVEKVAAANGGDAFPVGLKFSEDRLFNLAYLKVMGDSEVAFDYTPVYYWDMGLSSTVAKASPNDPESLIAFSEAVDTVGSSSGFSDEASKIIAIEVATHFRRSASLPVSQLWAASKSWHLVIESGVLLKCAGLLDEFIGGSARAYRPALTLLLADKSLGALMLAHAVKTVGTVLKSLGGDR